MTNRPSPVTPEEVALLGLSRAEVEALAALPSEQVARMETMARLHGLEPARLAADPDLHLAAALTCLACDQPEDAQAACPNAGTFRMLAAG
jgi:hypothetical protein